MRLGTSTNLLFARPDGTRVPLQRTLDLVSAAGFRLFDVNFYDWTLPGSVFLTDAWEKWIHEIAELSAKLGIEYGQCHGYTYNFLDPQMSTEEKAYHKELQLRAFKCCEILEAHTCVLHPETLPGKVDYWQQSLVGNYSHFSQLLEETKGVRIAIENMCDYGVAPRRKFGAYPEELLELVNALDNQRIGVCWDFEHGDIMEQDQRAALLLIQNHLYATHVSDTYSKTDNTLMHVLPMTGTVDWMNVMKTLREIAYQGDFCFEVHNFVNRIPDKAVPTALRLAFEIGTCLMNME